MMSQLENDSIGYRQQTHNAENYRQNDSTSYSQYGTAEKIYTRSVDRKNMLRLLTALVAVLLMLPFALLFMVFIGGSQGWISFAIVSFIIFLISTIAIDKIQ